MNDELIKSLHEITETKTLKPGKNGSMSITFTSLSTGTVATTVQSN